MVSDVSHFNVSLLFDKLCRVKSRGSVHKSHFFKEKVESNLRPFSYQSSTLPPGQAGPLAVLSSIAIATSLLTNRTVQSVQAQQRRRMPQGCVAVAVVVSQNAITTDLFISRPVRTTVQPAQAQQ